MRRRRAVAAILGVGVGLLAWQQETHHQEPIENDRELVSRIDAPYPPATPPIASADPPPHAQASQPLELGAMSESFRNTTLVTAIRSAGFYCDDVITSHESAAGVWVTSCRDRGGYKVSGVTVEDIRVEPIPHYVDAVF